MTGFTSSIFACSEASGQSRKRRLALLLCHRLKRHAFAFLTLFVIQATLNTASAQPDVPAGFSADTLASLPPPPPLLPATLDLAAIAVDTASGDIYALTRSLILPELIRVSSLGVVTTVTPVDAFSTVGGFYPVSFTDLEFNATLAASTSSKNLFSASSIGEIIGFNSTIIVPPLGDPGPFASLPGGGAEIGLASSADGMTLFATSGLFFPSALFSIDGSGVVTPLLSGVAFPIPLPSSLELSKDGSSLLFSSLAGGIYSITDISSSPVVDLAPVVPPADLPTPANFAVDPISGDLFIVSPPFGGAIKRFDGSTLGPFGTGFGSIGDLAFGPSTDGSGGTSLFVTADNSIIEISGFAGQDPVAQCQDVTKSADSNCEASVAPSEVDDGSFDPDGDPITLSLSPAGPYPLGATIVTLTVTDDQGASATCTATVTVIDDTPPTITIIGDNPLILECPTTYSELGADVSDACDESPTLEITGSVDSNVPGDYAITYAATDASGNTSSVERLVSVQAPGAPNLLCPSLPPLISELTDLTNDPFTPKKVRKRLEKSVKHLGKALKRCDDEKIDKAFKEVDHALRDLQNAIKAAKDDDGLKATLNEFIAELLALVQAETEGIIAQAICVAGEENRHVKKAQKHFEKGSNKLDRGIIHAAIHHFISAVKHARKALEGRDAPDPLTDGGSVQSQGSELGVTPLSYRLLQNYPNPFNPSTTISYEIVDEAFVTLKVYDVLGREVGVLVNRSQSPGRYQVSFNARDLPSGVYFYRLQVHDPVTGELYYLNSSKMILAK